MNRRRHTPETQSQPARQPDSRTDGDTDVTGTTTDACWHTSERTRHAERNEIKQERGGATNGGTEERRNGGTEERRNGRTDKRTNGRTGERTQRTRIRILAQPNAGSRCVARRWLRSPFALLHSALGAGFSSKMQNARTRLPRLPTSGNLHFPHKRSSLKYVRAQ